MTRGELDRYGAALADGTLVAAVNKWFDDMAADAAEAKRVARLDRQEDAA